MSGVKAGWPFHDVDLGCEIPHAVSSRRQLGRDQGRHMNETAESVPQGRAVVPHETQSPHLYRQAGRQSPFDAPGEVGFGLGVGLTNRTPAPRRVGSPAALAIWRKDSVATHHQRDIIALVSHEHLCA